MKTCNYKEDVGVLSEYADDAYFVTTDDFGCVLHEQQILYWEIK